MYEVHRCFAVGNNLPATKAGTQKHQERVTVNRDNIPVNAKMARMLEDVDDSEDEVHLQKKKKASKKQIVKHLESGDSMDEDVDMNNYPKLRSRACPTELFNAIDTFTNEQRRAVIDMGFSHILNIRVSKVPTQLAYWVLNSFDANSSEIRLRNGSSIPMDADDVHLVFGFPKGCNVIQTRKKSDVFEAEETFYNQFPNITRDRIVVKDVRDKMKKDKSGGDVFRRNFLVLLTSCLIETTVNGYIAAPLLRYMDKEGLKTVHQLNWCEYVIRSLIEHKRMWEKKKTNNFAGPILFLTAMYVDRVVSHGNRIVNRAFPTITGWTFKLLRKRERDEITAGGFGGGRICPQYTITSDGEVPVDNVDQTHKTPQNNVREEDEMHKFANEFLAKSKLMANTMMELILMIERAPKHLCDNPHFKKIIEAGQQLVGCKFGDHASKENERPTQFYEQDNDDAFWSDPECIAALDEIEKAILKRDEWKKYTFDGPSFSIGLTQEWEDVLNVSREVRSMAHDEVDASDSRRPNSESGGVECRVDAADDLGKKDTEKAEQMVQPTTGVQVFRRKLRSTKDKVESQAPVHQMVKRKGTSLKRTDAFLSPYHERTIDVSGIVDKKEKELYYWLVHRSNQDPEEVVFSYKNVNLRREELRSLRADIWISTYVIDVWTTILNHNEALRSTTSPCRFFATTDACRYATGNHGWDADRVKAEFGESLKLQLSRTGNHTLRNVDMFFFPVLDRDHYYVICFDVRKSNAMLIDNLADVDGIDLRAKYGATSFILQRVFADYMDAEGLKLKSGAIKRACMDRLAMPWRDNENNNDCGVYTMRHMETYMGQSVKSWDCGLEHGNVARMKCLRIKYCASILTSELNIHSREIENKARSLFAAACTKKQPSVNDILKGDV
ncbi:hypothetical protein C2S52_008345 [Perilla frutescens var. hirtella]|nr:hypothetical protein C2S52_008345 [Perilla frutescens var. hirtella]